MKFIALLALVITAQTFASSEFRFKCEFTNQYTVNQFALEAKSIVLNDEGQFSNVEFDLSLRKGGRDTQVERLVLTRDGSGRIFAPGTIYIHKSASLRSVIKGAEVEYINILINMPPNHTSEIRFLNGLTYHGTCTLI